MEQGAYSSNPVRKTTIALNNDQIKLLPTTPLLLVAPHGIGKIINVVSSIFSFNIIDKYKLSDDSDISSVSDIVITWGENEENASKAISAENTFGYVQNIVWYAGGTNSTLDGNIPYNPSEIMDDKGLYLSSDSEDGENYTGGNANNTLKVTVYYTIIDL